MYTTCYFFFTLNKVRIKLNYKIKLINVPLVIYCQIRCADLPCLLFSYTTVGIEFYVAAYVSDNWQFNKFWSNCKTKVGTARFAYLEIVGFSLFVFTRPRTVNFDHKTDILFHKAECSVNNLCIIWTSLKFSWSKLTPPYKACEMNNIPVE
ncbi:hypothetical protein ACJX0J_012054 [Zea mays]